MSEDCRDIFAKHSSIAFVFRANMYFNWKLIARVNIATIEYCVAKLLPTFTLDIEEASICRLPFYVLLFHIHNDNSFPLIYFLLC